MPLRLHHIVVLVKDLQKAMEGYRKLGFTVTPGGRHFGGISENAVILFKDGTYLELLAIRQGIRSFILKILYKMGFLYLLRKSKYGIAWRFYGRAFDQPEGLIELALLSDDLSFDSIQIKRRHLFLTKPLAAGRITPDGKVLQWKMLTSMVKELPFLIGGLQPVVLPDPQTMEHINGVVGLDGVVLVIIEQDQKVVGNFQNLLNTRPIIQEQLNHTVFRFELNDNFIDILIPGKASDLSASMDKYGLGIFAVKFNCLKKPLEWDLKLSHGLKIFG